MSRVVLIMKSEDWYSASKGNLFSDIIDPYLSILQTLFALSPFNLPHSRSLQVDYDSSFSYFAATGHLPLSYRDRGRKRLASINQDKAVRK
jgi:hypothetical protein